MCFVLTVDGVPCDVSRAEIEIEAATDSEVHSFHELPVGNIEYLEH